MLWLMDSCSGSESVRLIDCGKLSSKLSRFRRVIYIDGAWYWLDHLFLTCFTGRSQPCKWLWFYVNHHLFFWSSCWLLCIDEKCLALSPWHCQTVLQYPSVSWPLCTPVTSGLPSLSDCPCLCDRSSQLNFLLLPLSFSAIWSICCCRFQSHYFTAISSFSPASAFD